MGRWYSEKQYSILACLDTVVGCQKTYFRQNASNLKKCYQPGLLLMVKNKQTKKHYWSWSVVRCVEWWWGRFEKTKWRMECSKSNTMRECRVTLEGCLDQLGCQTVLAGLARHTSSFISCFLSLESSQLQIKVLYITILQYDRYKNVLFKTSLGAQWILDEQCMFKPRLIHSENIGVVRGFREMMAARTVSFRTLVVEFSECCPNEFSCKRQL